MKYSKHIATLLSTIALAIMAISHVSANDDDEAHKESEDWHEEFVGGDAHDEHGHNNEHGDEHGDEHGEEHGEEHGTKITDDTARAVGIITSVAGAQTLQQTITSYGTLVTEPEQLSHVRARYEGMIKAVYVNIGDTVKRGDLLAEIESNESLKRYRITAPIDGTIVQRHANTGETTQDLFLFAIANFDTLWAEIRLYPAQQQLVHAGQDVHIASNGREFNTTIKHVIPTLDTPYQLARVYFDNRKERLSPGLLVEAHIVTDEFETTVAVDLNGIQTMGVQEGVFVKHDDTYEFAPLQLGRRDERFVEVLAGLEPGTEYVSSNSYLIKADIEKSEAEHDH